MPVQTFYRRYKFAPTPDLENALFGNLNRRRYAAETMLDDPTQENDRLFFVEKGVVQGFYIDHAGEEITFALAGESEVILIPPKLFGVAPPADYLRALEAVTVFEMTRADLRKLQQSSHEFALLCLQLTEESIRRHQERARMLHNRSADSRYAWFLERHALLTNRVSIGIIASYLGMARTTLSRLRGKLAKQR